MSFREINQLAPVPTLDTTALFEIEQGGNSFRTDLADMLALHTTNLSNIIIDANKDWQGFDITNLGNLGVTGFVDIAEIIAPANPAINTGRLYVQDVAGTTTLFFRDSVGAVNNLLVGTEFTSWSQNHDANGFALLNTKFADFANPTKIVALDLTASSAGITLTLAFNQTTTQTLNFPDVGVADVLATENLSQTLANKTLTTPTIGDFSNAPHTHQNAAGAGQLDSTLALSDTADIAYLNTPNAYVGGNRQDFLGTPAGTAGINVGGIAGNPITQVDGDIWLNNSTNQMFARINGANVDIGQSGGSNQPFDDNIALVQNQADNTKLLRFDLAGNTTGIEGVIATIFTTAKTITIPDATDTLVGKATADFFTNKTFDVDATGNALIQATPTAGQYLRDDGAEFIGSAIQDVDLPAVVVRTNIANTFGDFAQTFADNQLFIRNPADSFSYQIIADAIIADRSVTLPLLLGNDIFVTEAFIQTLTNKSLGTGTSWTAIPTISDGLKITFNPDNTNAGLNAGQSANEPSVAINGDIFYDSTTGFLKGRNSGVWQQLGGEVLTWTDDHDAAGFDLLNVGQITINNPADTFQYIITPDAIVADRIVNLPLLTGPDTFVTELHIQTLSNKTIDSTVNTITIIKADISDFPILTADIQNDNVTFAKIENIVTNSILGRVTAGTGNTEELTPAQATTIINLFTDTLKGLVPASAGGTTNFLRADGTFAVPSGAGEANTISSDGGGLALTATIPKVGVDLRVRSLAGALPISVGEAADLITISSALFGAANTGHVPASGGGVVNFLRADGTWVVPAGGAGDMILAAVQTVTGAKTFADDAFLIQNPAITFAYLFQGGAIVADRTINLPVLAGNDTLVFEAHAQTLTNKVIDAANNTISNIGSPEVIADIITGQTALAALAADDELLIHDTSAGALRRVEVSDLIQSLLITCYDQEAAADNNFFVVSGGPFSGDTLELDAQGPVASDSLFQKLGVHVATSGQGDAWNWTLRINGADGNQTISIPASATGFFQDVSNTDTVSAGDLIAYQSTSVDGGGLTLTGATMVVTII